jgi:acyl transferase domain-containing protein
VTTNGIEGTNGVNGTNGVSGTNGVNGGHEIMGINGVNRTNGLVKSHRPMSESDQRLLVWSTADESGIARLTEVWKAYFARAEIASESQHSYLRDLAHTLASRRTHLQWRTFAVAADCNEVACLVDQMSAPSKASDVPKLGFVFTGVC